MHEHDQDNPGVIALPPLIFGGTLIAGLLLQRLMPLRFMPRALRWVLGPVLIVGGVALGGWASRTMQAAGTGIDPRDASTTIVSEGPFRYSRNPIYVSFTLFYTGIATLANAGTALLLLPAVLMVMRRGVIDREEQYLERKFGSAYLQYKAQVRRWL